MFDLEKLKCFICLNIQLIDYLQDTNCVIFNPRRKDWNSSWEQKIINPQFKEQVLEIRARGNELHKDLAKEYNVCKSVIGNIIHRRIWKWLT